MGPQEIALLRVHIASPGSYLAIALVASLVIRLLLALFRAYQLKAEEKSPFVVELRRAFAGLPSEAKHRNGKGPNEPVAQGDYLTPLMLGFLELVAYPPLLLASQWVYIGAWIGFKTIAQYKHWSDDRAIFNRYLVGNALVVLTAALCLIRKLELKP